MGGCVRGHGDAGALAGAQGGRGAGGGAAICGGRGGGGGSFRLVKREAAELIVVHTERTGNWKTETRGQLIETSSRFGGVGSESSPHLSDRRICKLKTRACEHTGTTLRTHSIVPGYGAQAQAPRAKVRLRFFMQDRKLICS